MDFAYGVAPKNGVELNKEFFRFYGKDAISCALSTTLCIKYNDSQNLY